MRKHVYKEFCSRCHGLYALNKDDTIRKHNRRDFSGYGWGWENLPCEGSNKPSTRSKDA